MERNLDRKTLSFGKGMTNVPSDLLSDDTELAESDGFIYRDGEMKAVQEAKFLTNIPHKVMYVHKTADYKNIIAYNENEGELKCYTTTGENLNIENIQTFEISKISGISSVGHTLIVATTEGLRYLLFKGGAYKDKGTDLPYPTYNVYFMDGNELNAGSIKNQMPMGERTLCNISSFVETSTYHSYYDKNGNYIGLSDDGTALHEWAYVAYKVKETDRDNFQNAVQGHAAAAISWAKENRYFCFPFYVRCALRLFDGSYARISAPILCYPTVNRNCCFTHAQTITNTGETRRFVERTTIDNGLFAMFFHYAKMYFSCSVNVSVEDWSDIVKEVVVFASDEVLPFKLTENWAFADINKIKGELYRNYVNENGYEEEAFDISWGTGGTEATDTGYKTKLKDRIMPQYKTDDEIIDELKGKTQFYKLFSIGFNQVGKNINASSNKYIKDGVLSTLTEQEQLNVDDYYGWTRKIAKNLYAYNNRINMFDIKRTLYSGAPILGADKSDNYTFDTYVHISSQYVDTWVKRKSKVPGGWFFYPDTNATEAILVKGDKKIRLALSTHPMLNGAYSFGKLLMKDMDEATVDIPSYDNTATEHIDSQIFTSVVNNPFVFEASGDNTVGTGKILGIVANTQAVSQGQFGQYPLLVFTDEGIYAMGVNSEGLYSKVYPVSREVCNNADSITPTDDLVFFTSNKGLMAISGGSAACLSEQMRGKVARNFVTMGGGRFLDFLKDSFIAYDYRDSLLRIYKKSKGQDDGNELKDPDDSYYYIYNMVDKTFSMGKFVSETAAAGKFDNAVWAIVNDFPDSLVQDVFGNIYSLTNKPDINDDETKYSGGFTTRPLKLGGSMTLKSIRAIKHLYDTDEGKVKLEVYGSNDCKHWVKLDSLGGKPWKYFTFKYELTDFKACDSFAGSIVEIQNRRGDKIR